MCFRNCYISYMFMYCVSVGLKNMKIRIKVILQSLDLKGSGFIFWDLKHLNFFFLWSGLVQGNTRLFPDFYGVEVAGQASFTSCCCYRTWKTLLFLPRQLLKHGGLLWSSGSAEACLSRGYQKSVSVTGVDVTDFKGQIWLRGFWIHHLLSSHVLLQIHAHATLSTQIFELWSWMIAKHINLSVSLALSL